MPSDGGSADGGGSAGGVTTGPCARQNFCHPLATCAETITGPVCICPSGYAGSGFGSMGCTPGSTLLHPCSINPCRVSVINRRPCDHECIYTKGKGI